MRVPPMNSPTDLITERLRLRRTRAGDARVLFRNYTGDPECSRYLQRLPHKDANQTQAMLDTWCEKRWDEPGAPFAWVIALRESDEPVGLFLAIPQDHATQIHYGIARRCWGQSLVAEAGRAVLDALRRNLQTRRVWTLLRCGKHRLPPRVGEARFLPRGHFAERVDAACVRRGGSRLLCVFDERGSAIARGSGAIAPAFKRCRYSRKHPKPLNASPLWPLPNPSARTAAPIPRTSNAR